MISQKKLTTLQKGKKKKKPKIISIKKYFLAFPHKYFLQYECPKLSLFHFFILIWNKKKKRERWERESAQYLNSLCMKSFSV